MTKKIKMGLASLLIATALLYAHSAVASEYIVWGTTLSVYAQSTGESSANLVRSSEGIYNGGSHPWCGNRFYIDFADLELFAMALTSSLNSESVNVRYDDAAETKTIKGHTTTQCKILSIWQ